MTESQKPRINIYSPFQGDAEDIISILGQAFDIVYTEATMEHFNQSINLGLEYTPASVHDIREQVLQANPARSRSHTIKSNKTERSNKTESSNMTDQSTLTADKTPPATISNTQQPKIEYAKGNHYNYTSQKYIDSEV